MNLALSKFHNSLNGSDFYTKNIIFDCNSILEYSKYLVNYSVIASPIARFWISLSKLAVSLRWCKNP